MGILTGNYNGVLNRDFKWGFEWRFVSAFWLKILKGILYRDFVWGF